MSELLVFSLVFGGFFVLRAVAATLFFYFILPQGDRCPNCDGVTLRMQQSRVSKMLCPGLRASWCYECDWYGFLRHGPLTPSAVAHELTRTP